MWFLEWLLDLDQIRPGSDTPLSIQWQLPYEPYLLFALALCLASLVILISRREQATPWQRVILATLRGGMLALLVAVLCRPVLVLQRERVDPSRTILLIDSSHSMARQESYADPDLAEEIVLGSGVEDSTALEDHSRLELVRRALLKDDAAPLRGLLANNELQLMTFSSSLTSWALGSAQDDLALIQESLTAITAKGTSTNMAEGLADSLRQRSAGQLAAIVLASDGQSTVPIDPSAIINLAKANQIPILPLRIGSPLAPADASIQSLVAEQNVFLNDLAAIRCQLSFTTSQGPVEATVRLIDSTRNSTVDSRTIQLEDGTSTQEIEFRLKPSRKGRVTYRAEIDPLPGETDLANNVNSIEIMVVDNKLRVLYVEGYPRYEYRYLKNALLREETIQSSCLLLGADADFAQEGTFPIRRFPETRDELYRYDVVIFGDVDPTGDWLSPAQATMLVEFVSDHGGGFCLVAGERFAPHRFRGTPLEKLIPVRIDPDFGGRSDLILPDTFAPVLTAEASHARCFRFDHDPQVSRQLFETLPGIYWVANTLGPRPGAESLLEHPTKKNANGPTPVMVAGRYGAGKVFFCGTDDLWRWRRHTGEFLYDIFWVQLTRMLMPAADTGQDQRIRIATDRRKYAFGERVEVTVEIDDPDILAGLDTELNLIMSDAYGAPIREFAAFRVAPESKLFEAGVFPADAGSFTLRCEEVSPRAGDRPATTLIQIEDANLESQKPEADHSILERLAEGTGGRVVALNELTKVLSAIPDRSIRIPDDITEPLWDSKLTLLLFLSLITTEWILRKVFGMV